MNEPMTHEIGEEVKDAWRFVSKDERQGKGSRSDSHA